MRLKKSGSTENKAKGHSTSCIRRVIEMNMINGSWKQGCLIQKKQLKTIE